MREKESSIHSRITSLIVGIFYLINEPPHLSCSATPILNVYASMVYIGLLDPGGPPVNAQCAKVYTWLAHT